MEPTTKEKPTSCELDMHRLEGHTLVVGFSGDWRRCGDMSLVDEYLRQIESGEEVRRVAFDSRSLIGWDSRLLVFLIKIIGHCARNNIETDMEGLPKGVQRLLKLAFAVPERMGVRKESKAESFLARLGEETIKSGHGIIEILDFLGEAFMAFIRMLGGKARFRGSDLLAVIQECSSQALPIVSLISLLVGVILAFVGAVLLQMFGVQIYVAGLVGFAMVRVMGAIMTGIIMAGRTGAAFAAQLGTMQVNEEIDALKTMGISPMEFLVLPRMIALFVTMPLLCVYADLMGILGGLIVGVGMFELNIIEYYNMTCDWVSLKDFWIGIFHGGVFGVLIALAGCLRGMRCGRSASAVGEAATSAVVTGIVSIIVATAIITVILNVLGL